MRAKSRYFTAVHADQFHKFLPEHQAGFFSTWSDPAFHRSNEVRLFLQPNGVDWGTSPPKWMDRNPSSAKRKGGRPRGSSKMIALRGEIEGRLRTRPLDYRGVAKLAAQIVKDGKNYGFCKKRVEQAISDVNRRLHRNVTATCNTRLERKPRYF